MVAGDGSFAVRRAMWGAVLALTLWLGAPAVASASDVYYAGNSQGRVNPFSIAADGTLAPIPCPGSNCSATVPAGVTVSPNGRFLYTGGYGGDISSSAINADGSLTPIPCPSGCNVGNQVFEVAITPDGRFLYAPLNGYPNPVGRVAIFSIGADGALTPVACPGTDCDTGGRFPNAAVVSPDGQFLYVASGNPDSLSVYRINADGTLTPVTCPAADCTPGSNPSGVSITPDGRHLYVANNNAASVSPFTVGADGSLTPIPCTGANCSAGFAPYALQVNPNGQFLYAADIGGSVVVYSIAGDGSLTQVPCPGCNNPGHFFTGLAVAPSGQFVYAATGLGNGTGTLSPFAVAADGTLTLIPCSTCDSGAQSNAQALAISPDQAPVAAFTATPAPPGQATTFDGSTSSAARGQQVARYDWSFGDGTTAADAGPTPSHTYAAAGSYTVTLTVTDDAGCSTQYISTSQTASCNGGPSATTTSSVTVATPPAPPAAGPATSATPTARITSLSASARCYRDAILDDPASGGRKSMRFNYTLTNAAVVRLTVRRRNGSPQWAVCPARRGTTPFPYTDVGSKTENGKAGGNDTQIGSAARVRVTRRVQLVRKRAHKRGRITLRRLLAGKHLAPGTYVLSVVALDAAGNATSERHVKFWVFAPRRR